MREYLQIAGRTIKVNYIMLQERPGMMPEPLCSERKIALERNEMDLADYGMGVRPGYAAVCRRLCLCG